MTAPDGTTYEGLSKIAYILNVSDFDTESDIEACLKTMIEEIKKTRYVRIFYPSLLHRVAGFAFSTIRTGDRGTKGKSNDRKATATQTAQETRTF